MRINRLKTIGIALVVAVAFGAVASSFASAAVQAPRWKVNGAFLAGNEPITGITTEAAWLNTPTIPLRLTNPTEKCEFESAKIIGSVAGVAGTATGFLKCTEISVHQAPVCVARSATKGAGIVTTNELTGTLVWLNNTNNKDVGITFEPERPAQSEFVNLKIEGSECALVGEYPVKNGIIGTLDPEGEKEVKEGTLTFPPVASTTCNAPILTDFTNVEGSPPTRASTAHTQLTVKAAKAVFCTAFKVKLTSGKEFGVWPG